MLSLSAKVFENIKGAKSSFTILRGENQIQCKVEFESSIKHFKNACRVKELLNSFFLIISKTNAFMVDYYDSQDSRSILIKLNILIHLVRNYFLFKLEIPRNSQEFQAIKFVSFEHPSRMLSRSQKFSEIPSF